MAFIHELVIGNVPLHCIGKVESGECYERYDAYYKRKF